MATAWSSINDSRPCDQRPRHRRSAASSSSIRFRPRFELVEDRTLLSTFSVTNTADSGPGSLRQAILDSNAATAATNTIDFAIPGTGVQTIEPASSLPAITQAVLIDGESQPGYAGTPLIELERQPGRQRRRPDDHRLECHGPRPGHRRLFPGRRHPHHGGRRHGRLDLRQLPGHRSDRHAGHSEQRGRRDRRGSNAKPHRDQRRRRERHGRAEPAQRQPVRRRLDQRTGHERQRRGGQLHRDRHHGIGRPEQRHAAGHRLSGQCLRRRRGRSPRAPRATGSEPTARALTTSASGT